MKVGAAFIQTLASQVIQSLASILTGVLIARGLGPAGQGRYATFAAGIALGAFLASLGQFHGNVLSAADRRDSPRVLLARGIAHSVLVLVVLSAGLAIWSERLIPELNLGLLFALVLSLEACAQMLRGVNLGQHHVGGWNIASLMQRFAYLAAVGILTWRGAIRLESVLVGWGLAALLAVLVSAGWIWLRSQPEPFRFRKVWSGWGAGLSRASRALLTVGLTLVLVRADIWMLGPMMGVATVGQMSVATYLGEWLWYVPSILGNLLFAVVAADRSARTVLQVARSSRLIAAALVVLMAVLMVVGRPLVGLLYGPSYVEAGVLFTLLLPGMAAIGVHLIIDAYFAGSGFPPITIWGAAGALAAKVLLNLAVIPVFGAGGAAAATSLVYAGLLTLKIIGFSRQTGVPWTGLLVPNRSDFVYVRDRWRGLLVA